MQSYEDPEVELARELSLRGLELHRCVHRRPSRASFIATQTSLRRSALVRVWQCEDESVHELLSDARLDHPHAAPTFAAGALPGGRIYDAVHFIRGYNLAQCTSTRARREWTEVVRFARVLCSVLAHAHAASIFHGTLHARKIWSCDERMTGLRLKGFGQRRVILADPDDTTHLAPETLRDGVVDARSDVYGLGLVLYEALSGYPAFAASRRDQLSREQLVGPRTFIRCDVPNALKRLVYECLAHDPARRPSSIDVVANRLAPLLDCETGHEKSDDLRATTVIMRHRSRDSHVPAALLAPAMEVTR